MNQRWLAYLSIGVFGTIVFVLFALRLQPVWRPEDATKPLPAEIAAPTVTFVDPALGPATAKVTLIVYGDFQCDYCGDASAAAQSVQRAYPKDVRVVWKDFPNASAHPEAVNAAVAAHCAARQGKFWEYHDALFLRRTLLSDEQYRQIARDVGLDGNTFAKCLDSQDSLPLVNRNLDESLGLRLTATPTVFINATRIVGAVSAEELLSYVRPILEAK